MYLYINGHRTIENTKKIVGLPHSGLIFVFLFFGLSLLFLNNIIHGGSKPLEYIYRFLFYSSLFAFIYGILLSNGTIQKDYVLRGILVIACLFVFTYIKKTSTKHLGGDYYLQGGKIKYNSLSNLREVEGISQTNYTILSENFIKDSNAVYAYTTKIEGLDPNACEIILFNNEPTDYIKDANHVYYNEILLKDADPNTFEVIEVGGNYYMAKDKNNTYLDEKIHKPFSF